MNFDHDTRSHFIPVILSHSLRLPAHSRRSVSVSTGVSSSCSPFVLSVSSPRLASITVPQKFLEFQDHYSHMTLSDPSSRSHSITRGTCIGYLCQASILPQPLNVTNQLSTPCGATNSIGRPPFPLGVSADKPHSCVASTLLSPNTLRDSTLSSSLAHDFHDLTKHVADDHQRNALVSLLTCFQHVFDTRKHNIPNPLSPLLVKFVARIISFLSPLLLVVGVHNSSRSSSSRSLSQVFISRLATCRHPRQNYSIILSWRIAMPNILPSPQLPLTKYPLSPSLAFDGLTITIIISPHSTNSKHHASSTTSL